MGSIPTAVWVGRKYHDIDVREHGSKNAGATNTFRVLGKKAGIIVLSIDIIKGFLATIAPLIFLPQAFGSELMINIQLVTSMACVLGHVFPVVANFDGGKGVATLARSHHWSASAGCIDFIGWFLDHLHVVFLCFSWCNKCSSHISAIAYFYFQS